MANEKRSKQSFKILLIVLGFIGLGAVFGAVLAKSTVLDQAIPEPEQFNGWMALWLFAAMFAALAVHELGHLIAGLAQGFVFELLVLGFLGLRRSEKGKIEVYLNKDWGLFGGVAATSPSPNSRNLAVKMGRILLAGPIASLLLTGFCFGFMPFFKPLIAFPMLVCGLVSLALFFATTVPDQTGVFYTDRKRYQRLTGGGKEREIEMALIQVMQAEQKGVSLQTLDRQTIRQISEDDAPMFRYLGFYFLTLFDRDNPEMLQQWRTKMAELEPAIPRSITAQLQKEWEKQANRPNN